MVSPIPQNQATFSSAELCRITQARPVAGEFSVRGVTTDSRGDVTGKLFVALSGARFDGHAFAEQALANGAAAVLVDKEIPRLPLKRTLKVRNSLEALGALAQAQRRRSAATVIAIAGSAGKTTTRAAISALLEQATPGGVHFALGNLNNRIGVPLVLLGISPVHRFCVVEIGTNQPGEVELLSRMVEPDMGVLTLIDIEHSEGLGDLDTIEQEEGALLGVLGPSGSAVYNLDDGRVTAQARNSRAGRLVSYGTGSDADFRLLQRSSTGISGAKLVIEQAAGDGPKERIKCDCPLLGHAGAMAFTAAIAVVKTCVGRIEADWLEAMVASPHWAEKGRLCPIALADGTLILDDTYNANPASMMSSIAVGRELAQARSARLGLVLGDMRELGALAEREHSRVGTALSSFSPAWLVAVGTDAEHLSRAAARTNIETELVPDVEAAIPRVLRRVEPGDVVLFKASRGVGLDRLVTAVERQRGRAR